MPNPFLPSPRPVLGDVLELIAIAAFIAGVWAVAFVLRGV